MDYQLTKFQFCEVVFGKVYRQIQKNNDDVIMTSFHVVGI